MTKSYALLTHSVSLLLLSGCAQPAHTARLPAHPAKPHRANRPDTGGSHVLWAYHLPRSGVSGLLPDSLTGLEARQGDVYVSGLTGRSGSVGVQGAAACFSEADGKLGWFTPVGTRLSTPAVAGKLVYLVDSHSIVHALSTTKGRMVWSRATGLDGANQLPILAGPSRLYVHGDQNVGVKTPEQMGLVAIDAGSGRELWRYVWPHAGSGWAWPALDSANDRMYLARTDGSLVVLDAKSGRVLRTVTHAGEHPVGLLLEGTTAVWLEQQGIRCFDLPDLRPRWRRRLSLARKHAAPASGYPASVAGGTLYCMALDEGRIYALDLRSGKAEWAAPAKGIWAETPFGHDDGYQFLVTPEYVVYMAIQPDSAQLYWLSRAHGRPLGSYALGDPVRVGYKVLGGSGETVYIAAIKSIEAIRLGNPAGPKR